MTIGDAEVVLYLVKSLGECGLKRVRVGDVELEWETSSLAVMKQETVGGDEPTMPSDLGEPSAEELALWSSGVELRK